MDQPNLKRQLSTASSSFSVWEPFQEERIRARAVDQETQNALANIGLKARMNVDRGYHTPVSSEIQSSMGSKPIFRTTTFIHDQVGRSAPLWSRTQSAPNHFQELQPFALSNSNSGLDPMEEEWIQSRRKGSGSQGGGGMILDSPASSQSGDLEEESENRPIGSHNPPMQVKRGRDLGEVERDDVLGRWAEADDNEMPTLSTSSSTLDPASVPSKLSSTPITLQRTISALPARTTGSSSQSPPSADLGRRPLSRSTKSMPVSTGFFNDPYSGFGLGAASSGSSGQRRESPEEVARHLYEASLARSERSLLINTPATSKEMETDDGDAQMEDLQQYISKQEGF